MGSYSLPRPVACDGGGASPLVGITGWVRYLRLVDGVAWVLVDRVSWVGQNS